MVIRDFLLVLYIIVTLHKITPKKVENSGNDTGNVITLSGLSTFYSLDKKIE